MAAGGYVKIYSNDGATLLFTSTNYYFTADATMTITETGVTLPDEAYTYSGQKKFLGLSTSSNATEAGYPVGDSGAIGSFTFYIVEGGEEQPEQPETTPTKKFTRLYIGDAYNEGYIDGKQAEYDRFWDEFQQNGTRTNYQQVFRVWTEEIFKPKYDIKPTGTYGGAQMFQGSPIKDLKGCFERARVKLDTSECTSLLQMFQSASIQYIPAIDARKSTNNGYTFSANAIISIEKFISSETTLYSSTTFDSENMETIIFEGIIADDGFRFSNCKKLSHESLMSIINALKDYSGTGTTRTCTLGEANLAKLTDAEKAIATEKGWTLA